MINPEILTDEQIVDQAIEEVLAASFCDGIEFDCSIEKTRSSLLAHIHNLRADAESQERWANHYYRAWQEVIGG